MVYSMFLQDLGKTTLSSNSEKTVSAFLEGRSFYGELNLKSINSGKVMVYFYFFLIN